MAVDHHIADITLADEGARRIDWALAEMPVVRRLRQRFDARRPLQGLRIAGCLHITTETANLAITLKAGGADLVLCASNPLSTQDDVAAALVRDFDIPVFAIHGEDHETYYHHIARALAHRPRITMDDGADLVSELHKRHAQLLPQILGSTEETTTGVLRLRAMASEGALKVPVVAVNDAMTKHLFDNRYGTGQSALDGIIRATNILIAGKTFTVVGYGWVGRGIAARARGLGAQVIVCEVDPPRALEAAMDGHRVMRLEQAAPISDFIVTATGDKNVVDRRHLVVMKDRCVLANAGHFNVEINIPVLEEMAVDRSRPRASVEEYELADGRLCDNIGNRHRLAETIRRLRPVFVVGPYFVDKHPDHEAAGRLIKKAVFDARLKKLDDRAGTKKRPRVLRMPIMTAARAIKTRKGNMILVR